MGNWGRQKPATLPFVQLGLRKETDLPQTLVAICIHSGPRREAGAAACADVDARPAQEVWRAWRRDTPGLTALPDVALRLVARLGLWRAAGAAQCVRWLEALLADHQYAQFEAWAPPTDLLGPTPPFFI